VVWNNCIISRDNTSTYEISGHSLARPLNLPRRPLMRETAMNVLRYSARGENSLPELEWPWVREKRRIVAVTRG